MQLTVYLHVKTVQDHQECLDSSKERTSIHLMKNAEYRIYQTVLENEDGPPWLKSIRHVMNPEAAQELRNKLCGVVIVFKIDVGIETRFFSVCFGLGHVILNKDTIEHNFGLITTLNSVKTLRRCSSHRLGARTHQKSILTNYDARVRELDFDFDEEVLALAKGRCPKNDLGTTIMGSDSLKLSSAISFEEIPAKLNDIYTRYKTDGYKRNGFDLGAALFGRRQEKVMERLAGQVCGVRVRDRRLAGWCR